MPRRRKTTEPAAAESTAAEPKVTKTAAIIAALQAHPDKMPKEIAEILQAQGLDVTPQMVSTTKFNMKAKKDQPAAPKAAPKKAPAPKAADAVSLDSLKKAKELATQLGGIKQAKAAIAALAELVD
jgi:peptidoglycan hydrolase CwlO-like protein